MSTIPEDNMKAQWPWDRWDNGDPTKTMLTDEDLIQHTNDLLDHTPMAYHQLKLVGCVDRFRATFGPVIES